MDSGSDVGMKAGEAEDTTYHARDCVGFLAIPEIPTAKDCNHGPRRGPTPPYSPPQAVPALGVKSAGLANVPALGDSNGQIEV